MNIQQIRNATLKITYHSKTFLLDPWLCGKGETGSFSDIPGQPFIIPDPVKMQIAMPIFPLPLDVRDVLDGVDYYVVTHLHPDHIDIVADGTVGAPLDRSVPVFTQHEGDAAVLKKSGFQDVRVVTSEGLSVDGVKLQKMPGRHGTIIPCGEAMGVLLSAADEEQLYIAGDTIWYEGVEQILKTYKPGVVALNACAAETVEHGRLFMGDEDVACVAQTLPSAKLFLTHMDTVSHASLTRRSLRGLLAMRGVVGYVMPEDGESVAF